MATSSSALNASVAVIISLSLSLVISFYIPSLTVSRPKPKDTSTSSSSSSSSQKQNEMETVESTARSTTTNAIIDILGVKIEKNPPQSKLDHLAVSTWPKWGCEPSKFPWTFKATETMYLLEGKVIVSVDGHEGSFEIGAGDFVVFPKGMKVTWDVVEAVSKHYSLEE